MVMGALLVGSPASILTGNSGGLLTSLAAAVPGTTPGTTSGSSSNPMSWPETRVAQSFDGMAPDAALRLATTHPAQVAALDGAPVALRYRANALLAGRAYAGRKLLLFDPAGTGRVVEVLGDLSTAHRIAVLVPGVDNRLADFDRGLGGVQRRAPAWQARQLSPPRRPTRPPARPRAPRRGRKLGLRGLSPGWLRPPRFGWP